jgi:hypothetical protein
MLDQVADLAACLRQPDSWTPLTTRYVRLLEAADALEAGYAVDDVRHGLVALYSRYVREWQVARESIERGLLPVTNQRPIPA